MSKLFHGLTKMQTKQLAYKFAKNKNIKIPQNWIRDEAAGEDWLKGFRKRKAGITLRQPEPTSLARAAEFNRQNVENLFHNLREVYTRGNNICPHNIFNLDETGISTVQKPRQVFAQDGTKQVGRITSGERGENVTMCACVNATGNALPPAFVFPRVHFKAHMLKGAPTGSLGLSCSSGWMNSDVFPEVLKHFIDHMAVSEQNPGLLILDNHSSHIGLEVINVAQKNGLTILTFPPHCSHRMQPLDVCIFGPFKRFYNKFADAWMTSHPGQSISIYDVAELAGAAFNKAFCMENIISAFKSIGIFPFNPNIFTDDMFLPAEVTDVPIAPNPTPDQEEAVMDPENTITEAHSLTFADEKALCTIMPHPKVSVKRFKQKSRQLKFSIITDKEAKLRRFPHIAEESSESEDLLL